MSPENMEKCSILPFKDNLSSSVVLAQESATIHSFMNLTISDAILGNINMLELKQRSRKGKIKSKKRVRDEKGVAMYH